MVVQQQRHGWRGALHEEQQEGCMSCLLVVAMVGRVLVA